MPIAFFLLSVLIALFPVLAIRDGLVMQSLAGALVAVTMAAAGIAGRAVDVQFAAQVTRRLGLAAAIPVLWMIIQLLPMPLPQLSHTIWINSNEALATKAWGHISVDIGNTVEALAFYLANIALILTSILVARNHRRAGRLFILLGAMTILTVVVLLADRFFHVLVFALGNPQDVLGAASALGLILSLTAGAVGLERDGDRQTLLFASGGGVLICGAGLAAAGNSNIAIVAAFGAATFVSIQLDRRLKLPAWSTALLLATLVVAAVMIVVWRFDTARALSPLLQFATTAPADSLAVAQRLLSDAGWMGAGAGTYAVLLSIYQEFGGMTKQPPSTAAAFAVEFGIPMVAIAAAISVALIIKLYRGALSRGRDSFYAAAASSGAVILLGQAFCDASLLHSGVAVIGDALVGVGLAQSASRADMG